MLVSVPYTELVCARACVGGTRSNGVMRGFPWLYYGLCMIHRTAPALTVALQGRNLVGQRLISQTLPRSPYCMEGSVHHWKVAEAPLGLLMNHTIRRELFPAPRHATPTPLPVVGCARGTRRNERPWKDGMFAFPQLVHRAYRIL